MRNPIPKAHRSDPLLDIRNLRHEYAPRGSAFGRNMPFVSLQGIDLEIPRGTTLALVGESGSGKSTLAKCVVRIEKPVAGEICFEGRNIGALGPSELQEFRRQVQLIFQDSATSLNPRFTGEQVVAEPLVIQGNSARAEVHNQVLAEIESVGLSAELAQRRPLELSGGQRQRLALARALMLNPRLLIFDEALSGLDLLVQKRIVDLLRALQLKHSLTYLFITHDLLLAQELAREIAVLREGRIVERIGAAELFTLGRHDYTRRLASSAQLLEFEAARAKG